MVQDGAPRACILVSGKGDGEGSGTCPSPSGHNSDQLNPLFLLTFYWLKLGHIATPSCKGGWELVFLLGGHVPSSKWEIRKHDE